MGIKWESDGIKWESDGNQMGSEGNHLGIRWNQTGIRWGQMGSDGIKWGQMGSDGVRWGGGGVNGGSDGDQMVIRWNQMGIRWDQMHVNVLHAEKPGVGTVPCSWPGQQPGQHSGTELCRIHPLARAPYRPHGRLHGSSLCSSSSSDTVQAAFKP